MNKYLIFRTDRIGDFLLSAILIKCIKRNDKNAFIIVVCSKKNFSYIKNFRIIDKVYKFENNIFNRFMLIKNLRKHNFKTVIIHDGKKRSRFINFFLNKDKFLSVDNNNIIDSNQLFCLLFGNGFSIYISLESGPLCLILFDTDDINFLFTFL